MRTTDSMLLRRTPVLLAPLLVATAGPTEVATPSAAVVYTISPELEDVGLTGVSVDVQFPIGQSGGAVLVLPDEWGGTDRLYRYLSPIAVTGGSVTTLSPTERRVLGSPGGTVTVRYRVSSAYDHEPNAQDAILLDGPVVRPDWFSGVGDQFIVALKGGDAMPAIVRWRGWPQGWETVASEDARASTVADVVGSSFIAGCGIAIRHRPVSGGTLRFVSRGVLGWSLDAYADRVARTIDAERGFWGDVAGDYTVTMIGLAPAPGFTSSGGTGRNHGFVQYASPDTQMAVLERNIAHEYMHNWLPRRVGMMPDGDAEATAYWFSEGFADFYTARTLLRSGLWTTQQFINDLNEVVARLATSKARNYTNAAAAKGAWTDQEVGQLAYDRGHLFAFLLDYALRRSGKGGLDGVMLAMRDRWLAAPVGTKPPVLGNLLSAIDAVGFNARPMITRYIQAGGTIALPADLFGGCASVADAKVATFDLGYDRVATAEGNGVFAGVRPAGPAYAAGLRNGMVRLAKLGGTMGVSRTPWAMRVRDGMAERIVTYYPQGTRLVDAQALRLSDKAAGTGRSRCARLMSGG